MANKDLNDEILTELKKHTKLLIQLNDGIDELVNAMYDDEDEESEEEDKEEVVAIVEPKPLDFSKWDKK